MKKMTSGGQPSGYKNPSGSKKASAIKVSQATIDNIKSAGMAAALKKAAGGASAAYVEGVKRMYGASRLNAAMAKVKQSEAGAGSGTRNPKQAGPMTGQASGYRNPSQAKAKSDGGGKYVGSTFVPNKTAAKAPVKKAAASKTKPTLGGFSSAAKAISSVGGRVERTPARQAELKALQARLKAKKNK
jgi:hypothetical protein